MERVMAATHRRTFAIEPHKNRDCPARKGAIFYWSIGYNDAPGEPRRRVSQIRFRRLSALSRHELERAASEARQLAELFGDD